MRNKRLILIIVIFTAIFVGSLLSDIKPVNAYSYCLISGPEGSLSCETRWPCNPARCWKTCSGSDLQGNCYYQTFFIFCWNQWKGPVLLDRCGSDHPTNEYRCSGDWRQKKSVKAGCSGSSCYETPEWNNDHYCPDGWYGVPAEGPIGEYACEAGRYRLEKYVDWWCQGAGECKWSSYYRRRQDCGPTTYGSWSYYCSGNSRYRRRTVYNRGCSGSSCYYYTSTQNEYVESCGGDYWTNEYRCSGNTRQRKYVNRGCSGSSCYANSEWKNVQNCGSTTYGSWSYYCSGNSRYRRRTVYNRGCSGSSCYYYTSTQTKFVQNCVSTAWTYYCPDDDLWRQRTAGSCSSGACQGTTQYEFYQDCGEDYCQAWSGNYCKDNDVYRQRTCYDKGCSGTSCFNNTYQDEEKVQECGSGYWSDEYQCQGNWSQRKWINQGCSGSSCSESFEWRNDRDCTATCYPGALGEGCAGGTYTCNVSSGKCDFPLQACSPPQNEPSGTVCQCNDVAGTIVRACDGSGSCLGIGEKCDTACGADAECQGLEPGDLYPGDSLKRCCKGQAGLPIWKEVAPY